MARPGKLCSQVYRRYSIIVKNILPIDHRECKIFYSSFGRVKWGKCLEEMNKQGMKSCQQFVIRKNFNCTYFKHLSFMILTLDDCCMRWSLPYKNLILVILGVSPPELPNLFAKCTLAVNSRIDSICVAIIHRRNNVINLYMKNMVPLYQ